MIAPNRSSDAPPAARTLSTASTTSSASYESNPFIPSTPNSHAAPFASSSAQSSQLDPEFLVHDTLYLYISPETLTLEPVYANPAVPRATLVIARDTGLLRMNSPPSPTLRQEDVTTVCGVLGILTLNSGDHLVVVTDRVKVGKICGHNIYRLAGYRVIPVVSRESVTLTSAQKRDDELYLQMLKDILTACSFYFSTTFDVTQNLQNQSRTSAISGKIPLWKRADPRYFWNRNLQKPIIRLAEKDGTQNVDNFILPIMCGFVAAERIKLNSSQTITLALISRRSQYRAGTRFNTRGIDAAGNVANAVETEQIVVLHDSGYIASYVQIRGSIPLFWRQVPNLKYQPPLYIDKSPLLSSAFRYHFDDLHSRYGRVIAVNLINKHGYERRLGEEFAREIQALNSDPKNLRYVHFDFHKECSKMRWDRLSLLIDELRPELKEQGYFLRVEGKPGNEGTRVVQRKQSSVVRTNCIDCLDRTNVVQSVLAREFLCQQLVEAEVLTHGQELEAGSLLEITFKRMWADNADAVSVQYSGTGALKTDFTRTGKRSIEGVLQDLMNSILRYIKNNFLDGFRQDGFDLLLGRLEVKPFGRSPLSKRNKPVRVFLLSASTSISFVMIFVTLILQSADSDSAWMFLAFWLFVLIGSLQLIMRFGEDFVNWSTLSPPLSSNDAVTEETDKSVDIQMEVVSGDRRKK
ncbi:SacI homology domain-containing protein [Zopfochytrium polystomum]|nr:SacI homology domain-containing protein [Zopfochytrium polystomum]